MPFALLVWFVIIIVINIECLPDSTILTLILFATLFTIRFLYALITCDLIPRYKKYKAKRRK